MENILFKKSYLLNNLKEIKFKDLWGSYGIFTTIRIIGKPIKILFFKDHINNLIKSLKIYKIRTTNLEKKLKIIIKINLKYNIKYNHLLRLAVNNKTISVSLRKRLKPKKKFYARIKNYKRINPKLKNLKYNKILSFLNNINISNTEVILSYKKTLLEGCTTNVLFVSRNKIYSPVKNIYEGTTLKFFKRKIKTIKKKDISLDRLPKFDEIILIGSGKGVVSVNSIDKPYWRRKSLKTYRFLSKIYQQAVTNCPRYND